MPRFHFNVHDGVDLPDEEGTELPDLVAAQREAVAFAGRMLADNASKFWGGEEWTLDVTNDAGLVLFSLLFSAVMAPTLSEGIGRPKV